jgi:hypothetical protein
MRKLFMALATTVAVATVTVLGAVTTVHLRAPSSPPLAAKVPDLAFVLPGVASLVGWEADRDARRAFRAGRGLLLGYNHGPNVGPLDECDVDGYDDGAGRREDLPGWAGKAAIGRVTVTCDSSNERRTFQFTVLECGNPFDTYQVVYGRAFNEEMLRLARLGQQDESARLSSP